MILIPVLLILPVGAISFTYGRLAAGLYATIVGPAASVLTLMWISLSAKRLFLKVDEQIAKSMGIEALMTIFRRIDELRLPDIENGKRRRGWIARLWPMPNMTDRLDHLRALGSR